MRRRGDPRDIHAAARRLQDAVRGRGRSFSDRVDPVAAELRTMPQVGKIVAFLRSAKRPVMMTQAARSHVDGSNR